ncbi:uncharacterized protein PFL1_05586 [Pseudozyma flocculosa PF-1]|uniref:Related to Protein mlo2 n=2 Tax=Pseudozyma flocculosa TaxID=84751 RepID=A0A5C3F9L9_9BASI|nr:uncharacterized protein PFL1_05586 [Pseudozyma flocculosa PF-1]EPQ26951.1 hypothetical protein PFL1_05586 [Pseudozyma flocculosa PF-1]SPO41138.1 related to Protein mlo2 [Pseudozyma flocculosa]
MSQDAPADASSTSTTGGQVTQPPLPSHSASTSSAVAAPTAASTAAAASAAAASAAAAAPTAAAAAATTAAASTTTAADDEPAHTALPDPSLPAPALAEEEVGFTAADLIARQARLEAEATDAIPFRFDTCTHSMGYIRQPAYACKTCGGGGVCAACSVACHSDHDLVELFNKRNFRCDCGTPNLYRTRQPNSCHRKVAIDEQLEYPPASLPCTLRKPGFDPQNEANRYNHNYDGAFCYCLRGQTYDPEKEDETMFQCLVCEEWLHESCTSLRPPRRRDPPSAAGKERQHDDSEPPLIDHDLFDLMICDACVRRDGNEMLRSYAGSRGWLLLLPSQQCQGAMTAWDGIPSIRVPTDHAKAKPHPAAVEGSTSSGSAARAVKGDDGSLQPAADEPSWQLFGLRLDAEASDGVKADETDAPGEEAATQTRQGCADGAEGLQAAVAPEAGTDGPPPQGTSLDKRKAEQALSDPVAGGDTEAAAKKVKTDPEVEPVEAATATGCNRPRTIPLLEKVPASIVDEWEPALAKDSAAAAVEGGAAGPQQRYDIFLAEDFRERICRCADCLAAWDSLPFVLEAEATYAPPSDHEGSLRAADDDAASVTSSTYDLGMAALRTMPREKMLNSLQAYATFRDALWEHLRPFAGSGKAVSEEDVRAFFRNRLKHGEQQ